MCDTIVITPKITGGKMLFAKNSDREPNEPQAMVFYPSQVHEEKELSATYIDIPQVRRTKAFLLSKPSWIWGGEMGINEDNVVIGNEAVFTKEHVSEKGLLGMDILRIALERASSADAALNIITTLIGNPGQGGNGGFTKRLMYHNSFIIADREKAWVLETAGKYWAAKKVDAIGTISNALSIGNDFDMIHPEAIEHAVKKRWCKSVDDFEFNKAFGKGLYALFSGGRFRKERTEKLIRDKLPLLTVKEIFEILRDHGDTQNITRGSMKTVCMHAGGIISSQTTASMVCEIDDITTVWVTNNSAPCLSVFKPVWFNNEESTLPYKTEEDGLKHWYHGERFYRNALKNYLKAREYFKETASNYELELQERVNTIFEEGTPDFEKLKDLSREAFEKSWKIVNSLIDKTSDMPPGKRSLYFKLYWLMQNREFKG
ncbi:MAG: C69 family dipeptidase [Kosmotoga sp.]|uniref:C69 family dipeptidase n=1 Tax=Kosmotoga sp. TaxID=1955248 RepID=UPI001D4BB3E3|nr:C69 family dipeptidase [Kosmotoga sp.]MBO8165858.1 C69 family dipeptidase [Kosmotoga sp.]